MTWYFIIGLGILIIVSLAFYAGQLLWRVKEQKLNREAEVKKRIDYITTSINHIAKAMKSAQCDVSEGVLRIRVLLDHYQSELYPDRDYAEIYPGFNNLYQVIKDMPTHEARKRTPKKELTKLDLTRWKAEQDYEELILQDLDKLLIEFE